MCLCGGGLITEALVFKRALAWLRLMRLLPTLTWVGASTIVGLSIAWRQNPYMDLDVSLVSLVFVGAVICHGLLSHSANDYADWISGTDKISPGLFSGGSRVIPEGYLSVQSLRSGIATGIMLGVTILVFLVLRLGSKALVVGLVAAAAAIFYSLPPFMLSYRPLVGEWLAVVPALASYSWLVFLAATNGLTLPPHELSLIYCSALAFTAHLMFHHLSDIEADLAAVPRKLTTPAYAKLKGWDPRIIPALYWIILTFLSLNFAHSVLVVLAIFCLWALHFTQLTDKKFLAYTDKMLFIMTGLAIVLEAILC